MAYPYRSILNPIQFDDPSLLALGLAKLVAADHGATLHLLHVAAKLRAIGEPEVSEDEHSPAEEQARAKLQSLRGTWPECSTRFTLRLRPSALSPRRWSGLQPKLMRT